MLQETIRILKDLVAFPVLGGESNLSIAGYIAEYLEGLGVEVHFIPNAAGDKRSIHCRIGPTADGGIVLSGHTDVVPVAGQDWQTDPFTLTKIGDKWYARGSADMKGFLACCLAMAPAFLKADLKRPIYLAFSYDEEVGCLAGAELAETIMHFYPERPRYALIGEPSMLQPLLGHKGICVLKTTVLGSAGHSSRIKSEVSAIHEAAKLVVWLENKMNDLVENGTNDPRFTPPHSSIHIGQIAGGVAPNVIADKCTFYWDVRIVPGDRLEDVLEAFAAHCAETEETLRKRFSGSAIITEEDHPLVPPLSCPEDADLVQWVKTWTGNTHTSTAAYAAEAGQFAEAGFEALICGPGDIAQAHRANEFVAEEQLAKCLDMLGSLMLEFSK
ncbi:MAG TPA: acetylornithine deacetylase [Saprospiraceae bacterium]|nr:acetylornithine deacetylase [Saprospiraceae bacterium]HMQ82809.1 acetylornithine deacetylase [Saprospiraceae bacterium]